MCLLNEVGPCLRDSCWVTEISYMVYDEAQVVVTCLISVCVEKLESIRVSLF